MNRAELQALLVGVPLPASKAELLRYALAQSEGARAGELLARIPDRVYRSIPEVGESVAPVQPRRPPAAPLPAPESDLPPGGDAYVGRDVEPINVANLG